MSDIWLNKINWSDDGLVQVVTQEAASNKVLMVAWMNRDSTETHRANRRGTLLVSLSQETLA